MNEQLKEKALALLKESLQYDIPHFSRQFGEVIKRQWQDAETQKFINLAVNTGAIKSQNQPVVSFAQNGGTRKKWDPSNLGEFHDQQSLKKPAAPTPKESPSQGALDQVNLMTQTKKWEPVSVTAIIQKYGEDVNGMKAYAAAEYGEQIKTEDPIEAAQQLHQLYLEDNIEEPIDGEKILEITTVSGDTFTYTKEDLLGWGEVEYTEKFEKLADLKQYMIDQFSIVPKSNWSWKQAIAALKKHLKEN